MKPEDQRIAIAEACGELKQPAQKATVSELEAILNDPTPRVVTLLTNGEVRACRDCLSDLNACHEMLNTLLSDGSWSRYRTEIEKVCNTLGQPSGTAWFIEHNATAPQRCEAFLRCLNLWVEDSEAPSVQARPDNV